MPQHAKYQNLVMAPLNRGIFTRWKHLESEVNACWYNFKVIKRKTFHYLTKSISIPELLWNIKFESWRYQILVILLFGSDVTLI